MSIPLVFHFWSLKWNLMGLKLHFSISSSRIKRNVGKSSSSTAPQKVLHPFCCTNSLFCIYMENLRSTQLPVYPLFNKEQVYYIKFCWFCHSSAKVNTYMNRTAEYSTFSKWTAQIFFINLNLAIHIQITRYLACQKSMIRLASERRRTRQESIVPGHHSRPFRWLDAKVFGH